MWKKIILKSMIYLVIDEERVKELAESTRMMRDTKWRLLFGSAKDIS